MSCPPHWSCDLHILVYIFLSLWVIWNVGPGQTSYTLGVSYPHIASSSNDTKAGRELCSLSPAFYAVYTHTHIHTHTHTHTHTQTPYYLVFHIPLYLPLTSSAMMGHHSPHPTILSLNATVIGPALPFNNLSDNMLIPDGKVGRCLSVCVCGEVYERERSRVCIQYGCLWEMYHVCVCVCVSVSLYLWVCVCLCHRLINDQVCSAAQIVTLCRAHLPALQPSTTEVSDWGAHTDTHTCTHTHIKKKHTHMH